MKNDQNNQNSDYRGMRALLMTRVSTPKQEEGYGHPAQEQQCMQKVVGPLGLKVVETIRDTYSGLEFRERQVLHAILEKAKRGEFDILVMDVLDRLGRKGLERELWRMQLRETGVRMLTTDPEEHADDDSSWGELIRVLKGIQAEDELKNIMRRTMNGKRAKAEGRKSDGTVGERQIVGNGPRLYGYHFKLDERGKKIGFTINDDVFFVESDGTKWTEAKIVKFMFESAASGVPIRRIAIMLNEKGIPPATRNKNIKFKDEEKRDKMAWQGSVVQRMLHQSAYWGEYRQFLYKTGDKLPGRKKKKIFQTPEEHQVIVPVPAIISQEVAEAVQRRLQLNKQRAARNNKAPLETLLRAGYIKCGECGANLCATANHRNRSKDKVWYEYYCMRYSTKVDKDGKRLCKGASITANVIDTAVWNKALEIIQDPSEIDEKLAALRSDDPTANQRKTINEKLVKIRKQQDLFRGRLAKMMMEEEDIDTGTEAYLKDQLKQLALDEASWKAQLAKDEFIHLKWKTIQEKVDELHKECAVIREKINDPNYEVSYEKKRDYIEFLGITATVWKAGSNPRYKIECNPPSIVTLISITL